ncbi:hypothetical protein EJ05DRAFT_474115 [Pseudovirgaria hyperparasitica]|uniref:Roadblock/LAMTOR2 domain-containing protein n=1 Tax=Pseudovirgaria hyperparasitica TaxID=470096 RepID=A0A6A6WCC4_9PEZI|nr:uncharacterized protein EJ05DRAFT_474115 [Pseudovirgaria hyperparasitica]KAF2760225.1 hypothetical protein EJ05DRAFT_474115 [Pseudovirgaria hyperparasitica]
MLEIKALSDFLSRNAHEIYSPVIFVMSPNGTLIAYNTPVEDIKALRSRAAIVSMVWNDRSYLVQQGASHPNPTEDSDASISGPELENLTIEAEDANIFACSVQKGLILVMEGVAPPGRKAMWKVTPEVAGAPRYPLSGASGREAALLDKQRSKVEGMVAHLREDFAESGFVMPDGSAFV